MGFGFYAGPGGLVSRPISAKMKSMILALTVALLNQPVTHRLFIDGQLIGVKQGKAWRQLNETDIPLKETMGTSKIGVDGSITFGPNLTGLIRRGTVLMAMSAAQTGGILVQGQTYRLRRAPQKVDPKDRAILGAVLLGLRSTYPGKRVSPKIVQGWRVDLDGNGTTESIVEVVGSGSGLNFRKIFLVGKRGRGTVCERILVPDTPEKFSNNLAFLGIVDLAGDGEYEFVTRHVVGKSLHLAVWNWRNGQADLSLTGARKA